MQHSVGFQTEIEFELPKGFVDATGELHRKGVMRLATAADEILPQRDPRVRENEAYFTVIVLARVITQLGNLKDISTTVIEGLFAGDLAYLQELYGSFNSDSHQPQQIRPVNGSAMLGRFATMGEA